MSEAPRLLMPMQVLTPSQRLHPEKWPMVLIFDAEANRDARNDDGSQLCLGVVGDIHHRVNDMVLRRDFATESGDGLAARVRDYIAGIEAPKITVYCHTHYDVPTLFSLDEMRRMKPLMAGSRLLKVTWRIQDVKRDKTAHRTKAKTVEFRDIAALIPLSIEELGAAVGVPKGMTPQKFIDGTADYISPDDVAYCRQDVEVARRGLHAWHETLGTPIGSPLPLTCGSSAYRLWCDTAPFPAREDGRPRPIYANREAWEAGMQAVHGGRVECRHPGRAFARTLELDVTSLYPYTASMALPDPFGRSRVYTGGPNLRRIGEACRAQGALTISNVVLDGAEVPERYLFLPTMNERLHKLEYHHRRFEGWLCNPEMEAAVARGWTLEETRSVAAYAAGYPLRDYMMARWHDRSALLAAGSPMAYAVKILMNSLPGKFSQRDSQECEFDPDEIARIETEREPGWHRVAIGDGLDYYLEADEGSACLNNYAPINAFVTSYARVILQRAIEAMYPRWLYSDTDSVHLAIRADEEPEDVIAEARAAGIDVAEGEKRLGAWWPEVHGATRYHGAKDYVSEGVVTRKGAPRRDLVDAPAVTFETVTRFKTALTGRTAPGEWMPRSLTRRRAGETFREPIEA